jgi:probable phosphoglycerate mutase
MRLYLIRHGETAWNTQLCLQGQTDIELNENGRALAEKTAQALHGVPFTHAITSPLARARETAQILLAGRDVPIEVDPRISEISFGSLEGIPMTREMRETPGSEFYHFFHEPQRYQPSAGAERLEDLLARTAQFLADLKERSDLADGVILVSTHGAALRALLAGIDHVPLTDFWQGGVPKNCSISIVDLEQDEWMVRRQDILEKEIRDEDF